MAADFSQSFESSSLVTLGYHWLSLATTHLVDDNKEVEIWDVFWGEKPGKHGEEM